MHSEGNLQISLCGGFWHAVPGNERSRQLAWTSRPGSAACHAEQNFEEGGAYFILFFIFFPFLAVVTFYLFLINTSVTRNIWVSSLGARFYSFFFHPSFFFLLENCHTCSVSRCSSHLCWGEKEKKKGNFQKRWNDDTEAIWSEMIGMD